MINWDTRRRQTLGGGVTFHDVKLKHNVNPHLRFSITHGPEGFVLVGWGGDLLGSNVWSHNHKSEHATLESAQNAAEVFAREAYRGYLEARLAVLDAERSRIQQVLAECNTGGEVSDLRGQVLEVVKARGAIRPEVLFDLLQASGVSRSQVRAAMLELVDKNEVIFTLERTLTLGVESAEAVDEASNQRALAARGHRLDTALQELADFPDYSW